MNPEIKQQIVEQQLMQLEAEIEAVRLKIVALEAARDALLKDAQTN